MTGGEDATDSLIGAVLADKWTVEKVLGVGGMAVVYAARHRNGHRVAIKMLRSQMCSDSELVERFAREGYVANRVDHAGTTQVIDDGLMPDGTPYLVMELLSGETLALDRADDRAFIAERVNDSASAIDNTDCVWPPVLD